MIYWRKTYVRNYAKGIAASILIHLVFVSALVIPRCEDTTLPERQYISTYKVNVIQYTVDVKDIIGNGLDIGGSSGLGNNANTNGGTTTPTLFGTPVASSSMQDEIDFGMTTNLNKVDSVGTDGFGTGEGNGNGNGSGGGIGDGIGGGSGTGRVYKSLPFIPRQILEVLPDNSDGVKGYIILALRISIDGKAKEHKVMMNSVDNSSSLQKVIEAAYKSRWQPVKMDGEKVEYWIEKTYMFN
jgi:hypothetical protein